MNVAFKEREELYMNINMADLYASLDIMWKGMLGLFACCGFIALLTMLLNKILTPKEKKEQ